MREIFFHEDDYCQIELVAAENHGFCAHQMGLIDSFSERHRSDAGWAEMYVRSDNLIPLSVRNISRRTLEACIPAASRCFDRVFTGYASFRMPCDGVMAYGPNDEIALFAEFSPEGIVTVAWFHLWIADQAGQQNALALLNGLSGLDCLLADWSWGRLYRLDDHQGLEQYVTERRAIRDGPAP